MIQNHGVGLNWLNKSRGEFSIAIGADGAPAGKLGTHTSLLLSFLNTTDRVGSCDHNFLLCGGDVTEDDPTFLNRLSKIIKDMTDIEKREYIIGSDRVKFKLEMIPADCKWAAVACGELSNAATYPSTFGNVHKDELSKLNASIGFESHNTWQPWGYQQRMAHAKEVSRVKEKVNVRGKVLKTIANMRSRQEFEPVIGKYSDKCYLEPLHVKNNACQQLNIQLLFDVIARTEDRVLKMDLQSDEFLASPIGQYLYSLKNTVKAGKLHTRLLRWFKESRNNLSKEGVVKCTIRFTGEDSMKFLNHFPYLIEALNKPAEKSNFVKYRQLLFHVASTLLREIVALSSKIKFSQFELEQLKASCEMYHALHALFFTKVTLTTWHIGYALPFHANLIYSKFGVGLGINTMQGREAKHRQISNYAKFTIPQQKWTGIFRHEYIHLIWLKEHDLSEAAKEIAKKRDHSKYHVSQISPDLCSCGLSAASSICIFCNHPGRKLILESIAKRRVLSEVRQLME